MGDASDGPFDDGRKTGGLAEVSGLLKRSWLFRLVPRFRWLLFPVLLGAFGWDTLTTSLGDAQLNYAEVSSSDWEQTNIWLKSTQCARETGAWLVVCGDDGKLIPISEQALGDDPGHAFLLDIWAITS